MQDATAISSAELKPFHDKVNEEADLIIDKFIYGFFLFGVAISLFYESYLLAFLMGGASVAIHVVLKSFIGGTFWFRVISSLLLWNFAVQFIFQMHGMYEMHFFYFIGLTVLLFYEDWRLLIPNILYALFTFLYLFFSQTSSGEPGAVLENLPPMDYKNMIIHVGILVLYGALCILWSRLQYGQTKEAAINNIQMQKQLALMDININCKHETNITLKEKFNRIRGS